MAVGPIGYGHVQTVRLRPMTVTPSDAHAGDRIDVSPPAGELPRRGIVTEVLGAPGHERYRVRRLDGPESIHHPSGGTRVRPRAPHDDQRIAVPDGGMCRSGCSRISSAAAMP